MLFYFDLEEAFVCLYASVLRFDFYIGIISFKLSSLDPKTYVFQFFYTELKQACSVQNFLAAHQIRADIRGKRPWLLLQHS